MIQQIEEPPVLVERKAEAKFRWNCSEDACNGSSVRDFGCRRYVSPSPGPPTGGSCSSR